MKHAPTVFNPMISEKPSVPANVRALYQQGQRAPGPIAVADGQFNQGEAPLPMTAFAPPFINERVLRQSLAFRTVTAIYTRKNR